MDTFLLGVGVVGILSTLYWADALGMIGALLINTIGAADNRVNDLLFRQVRVDKKLASTQPSLLRKFLQRFHNVLRKSISWSVSQH